VPWSAPVSSSQEDSPAIPLQRFFAQLMYSRRRFTDSPAKGLKAMARRLLVLSATPADARKKLEDWRKYYNEERPHGAIPGSANDFNLVITRSCMKGFIILDYAARFPEAISTLAGWLKDGKLKQKEDVATGLENAPDTLVRLFTGESFGKQLLKIGEPPLERVN